MNLEKLFNSELFCDVYGNDPDMLSYHRKRITNAVSGYEEHFGSSDEAHVFSAAGRSEIGVNHTDH